MTQERLNLVLTPELEKQLNEYVLEVHKKLKKLPPGIKTKIGRKALQEWLDRNKDNFDIWRT